MDVGFLVAHSIDCRPTALRLGAFLAMLAGFAFIFSLLRCFPRWNSITRAASATPLSLLFPSLGAAVVAGW